MLTELKVSQFAIIDKIHIHFDQGFNILSGETGAGKSILIKSLALLMGAKSSNDDIRGNKEMATIEGAFDISKRQDIQSKVESMGIENNENHLIVRRILHKNGKSKVYLNGHLSTVSDLRKIVFPLVTISNPTDAPLLEITGQHENKSLMSSRYQMDTLDQFCGNSAMREKIKTAYLGLQETKRSIENLQTLSQQREQQLDFLSFQINEIETLNIKENEDDELKNLIKDIKEKGLHTQWLEESVDSLHRKDRSVLSLLRQLIKTAPSSDSFTKPVQRLEQLAIETEDLAFDLQNRQKEDSGDQTSIDELEDRLSRIRKLQKKFGSDTPEILDNLQRMRKEFSILENISTELEELEKKSTEQQKLLEGFCKQLSKKRKSGSLLLSKEINEELKELNMKGLIFVIEVAAADSITSHGADQVHFLTKTGKGEKALPLIKAASGGELSRILLSLKQVIGANQFPRTFLFDEVDTGVSGETAEKVGAKLKNLAQYQQVICVTHLPQVASFGDHHLYIEKRSLEDRVEMSVEPLKKQQRIQEIARLISGEKVTKTSLAHAKQLLSVTK